MRLKEYHFDYVFCTYRFSKYKKIAPAALYVKVYILLPEIGEYTYPEKIVEKKWQAISSRVYSCNLAGIFFS